MTGIDCITAEKYWKKDRGGPVGFLKAIGFIAIEEDDEGRKYISLSTDEEGNSDIRLTKASAEWLIEALKECIKEVEK
jgi:hypothetical protein